MATPKRRRGDWQPRFIESLRASGNISTASAAAGISRQEVYKRRDRDAGFREAWNDALDEACDSMEAEARRRAVDGVEKPVYYQGKVVGAVREYSDNLLMFMLKAHRPERFADRVRIEHSVKERIKVLAERYGLSEKEVMAQAEAILRGDG